MKKTITALFLGLLFSFALVAQTPCDSLSANWVFTPQNCMPTQGTLCATFTTTGTPSTYLYQWRPPVAFAPQAPLILGTPVCTTPALAATVYTLRVTSSTGCSREFSYTTPIATPLAVTATGTTTTCSLANGGTVTNTSGGTAPYTYLWSNGATTANLANVAAGTYHVTVTDALGCTATTPLGGVVVATSNPPVLPMLAFSPNSCGDTLGAACKVGPLGGIFTWTGLPFGDCRFNAHTATTYGYSYTDVAGCITTGVYTTPPPLVPPMITAAITSPVKCTVGGTISATVDSMTSYQFALVNLITGDTVAMATSAIFVNDSLPVGMYEILGCTACCIDRDTVTLVAPVNPVLTFAVTPDSCAQSMGMVTAVATNGVGPYTYMWSNGATTASIDSLSAGSYPLTVTDAYGCTVANTASVVNVTCSSDTSVVFCWGDSVIVNTTWYFNSGNYTQILSNGDTLFVVATELPQITATATDTICPGTMTLYAGQSYGVGIHMVVLPGTGMACDTFVTLNITAWNVSDTVIIVDTCKWNVAPVSVMLPDLHGCMRKVTTVFNSVLDTVLQNKISCVFPSGTITTNLRVSTIGCDTIVLTTWSAGTVKDTTIFNRGCVGDSLDIGGVKTVFDQDTVFVVTNNFQNPETGCDSIVTKQVVITPLPVFALRTTQPSCKDSGSVAVFPTVVTNDYTWSNGSTDHEISPAPAGDYSVTVSDENGCEKSDSTKVISYTPITLDTNLVHPACDETTFGAIELNPAGGSGPLNIIWLDSPGDTSLTRNGLLAGTYWPQVTDSAGCQLLQRIDLGALGCTITYAWESYRVHVQVGLCHITMLDVPFTVELIAENGKSLGTIGSGTAPMGKFEGDFELPAGISPGVYTVILTTIVTLPNGSLKENHYGIQIVVIR